MNTKRVEGGRRGDHVPVLVNGSGVKGEILTLLSPVFVLVNLP